MLSRVKIDLVRSYHQIPLHEAAFQRLVDVVAQDLPFVFIYLDDATP